MRILLVGINYAPDLIGVAKYNTELCESLVAEGHEVRVITAPPYYPAWRIPAGFDSHYFRARNVNGVEITRAPIYVPRKPTGAKRLLHHASFALTSALPMLTKALEWHPDVMLSTAPSLMSSALVSFVARRIGVKSWLHVQDFEVDAAFDLGFLRNGALRRLMLGAESRILRSFDRVSSISPQMVDRLLAKGVPAERTVEIRNWIDTNAIFPRSRQTRYRHEFGIGESDIVGLYSGTMSTKQGLDLVIDAASILQHSHPDIHFILAGEGPDKARLIKMAAGRSNVHFLGLQPNESFNELMATADVHLIPQKAEAADLVLPSKLGAVLGSARPVIAMATEGTGLAEEVNGAGMVVSPGDTRALADAICTLAQNPALCAAFRAEGRKRSLERWDRRAIVGRWALEMSAMRNAPVPSGTQAAMTAGPPDAITVKDAIRLP
ncbi:MULTISPECIES: WcaI family glycosyltransferase [unclassified Bradyrhizobium]|uniref:WcaI family glycosyltransferase n=1 Tax=unclassified Bradyrhizobium TaxID=2631580 RepID=UPI001BA94E2A|nr:MULTISPECIES: WcaI family glycosyltransferase [unclassified Bradyrhizobium]MBR1207474.1 WcaI family glycosyltransferase [Bradyrhizobium sp. AUGA SZCCT0124]MBR1315890.1 WcaI family glycosyltransferase [Bradyrhizobium sp. AUGA SZCCT0051]MBR1343996.1 WcaI family glycosyltransferase [Bradyrhizobium sp. AUGA SZCCT0105]MBR1358017.1 WcaI family glycosyltransferase [Bradyrhizobium sp. AUGA SZCCT0045]